MHAVEKGWWEGKRLFPWDVLVVALSYCKEHTVPCTYTAVSLNLTDEVYCLSPHHCPFCALLYIVYQSSNAILFTLECIGHDEDDEA